MLLYGIDPKLAGSLSLAVSPPTMLVAFARYSRDDSLTVLRNHARFVTVTAAGSAVGTLLGGLLLGIASTSVLVPLTRPVDRIGADDRGGGPRLY